MSLKTKRKKTEKGVKEKSGKTFFGQHPIKFKVENQKLLISVTEGWENSSIPEKTRNRS